MNRVFADTAFYVAAINASDGLHNAARTFAQSYRGELFTTEYVLVELRHWFLYNHGRDQYAAVANAIRTDPHTTIIPADGALLAEGASLYASRPDQNATLTDCISFVVMKRHNLTHALTPPGPFSQAGFTPLLIALD